MKLLLIITILVSIMNSFSIFSVNEIQRGIVQDCGTHTSKVCPEPWENSTNGQGGTGLGNYH